MRCLQCEHQVKCHFYKKEFKSAERCKLLFACSWMKLPTCLLICFYRAKSLTWVESLQAWKLRMTESTYRIAQCAGGKRVPVHVHALACAFYVCVFACVWLCKLCLHRCTALCRVLCCMDVCVYVSACGPVCMCMLCCVWECTCLCLCICVCMCVCVFMGTTAAFT